MNGNIYRIPIQGYAQNLPHPHVVLIELDKECWIIPAFGADGPEIERLLNAHEVMGFNRADVAVHMDNGKHVSYHGNFTGIVAYWAVARALKVTKAHLATCEHLGQMKDDGLLLIAQAVARLAKSKPDFISPALQKKVRKLIESLSVEVKQQASAQPATGDQATPTD